jgi:hypothetical protein
VFKITRSTIRKFHILRLLRDHTVPRLIQLPCVEALGPHARTLGFGADFVSMCIQTWIHSTKHIALIKYFIFYKCEDMREWKTEENMCSSTLKFAVRMSGGWLVLVTWCPARTPSFGAGLISACIRICIHPTKHIALTKYFIFFL